MRYPAASAEQISAFEERGWLVVRDAVEPAELELLGGACQKILDDPQRFAFDWAWEKGKTREERSFKIVQGSPSRAWPGLAQSKLRAWAVEFGSALLARRVEFWYDQFLAKPPAEGARTYWHQDEGYWGRNLFDRGITCWMPLDPVDERNGCMHFIDRGHRDGILRHRRPEHVQSDLLCCDPDTSREIACPIGVGDVTFHHSKTPHMTPPNRSAAWRRAVTQHLCVPDSGGEGDHYPWKIYVNQFTGERSVPPSREPE